MKKRTKKKVTVPEKQDYGVTAETFIAAWQTADSLEEVADITGIPKPVCSARASKYRGDGIKLKRMSRRSSRALDVDSLNRLIEKINEKHGIESMGDEIKEPKERKPLTKKHVQDIVRQVIKEISQEE